MTNKRSFRRVLGVALLGLTMGACDFISPIDSNPNAVAEANVDQLFTGVQVNTFFLASSGLSRIASIWTQQMAGTDRQFVTFDNYTITESDFEDEFDAAYTQGGLVDIRSAIAQAEEAGRLEYAGILKIHEAYQIGMTASFYGDIPYREAANPDIATPVLDEQRQVYDDVQDLLDEAIGDLGQGGAGPGSVDLNFGGSTADWIAVARTLKARFHMHWGEVDGPTAYTAARDQALQGIDDTSDDWRAIFSDAATESNPWYQFERDRSGYVSAGDYLVPLMVGNSDPRTDFYYSSPATARASNLSPTGFGAPGFDFPIVTCAENAFILAEAEWNLAVGGDFEAAKAAARDAITCQEDEWNVDLSGQDDAFDAGAGNGATGDALLSAIMEQKYIAMFLNPEAYNDYKRTCRPAISERANGMPGRLFYSINERQTNPNVPDTGTDPNDKYNDNDEDGGCPQA